jgi:hypothetical protein
MVFLILIAVTVVPMAAIWYGAKVFGWGFHNYPKTAGLIAIVCVFAVVFAGLTFHRVFPNCRVALKWGCSDHPPQAMVKSR